MLSLKERWEKVKVTKMASRKRRALHKSSGISGRRKIQRFGIFMVLCIISGYVMITS
jgi:hypothetical protein